MLSALTALVATQIATLVFQAFRHFVPARVNATRSAGEILAELHAILDAEAYKRATEIAAGEYVSGAAVELAKSLPVPPPASSAGVSAS